MNESQGQACYSSVYNWNFNLPAGISIQTAWIQLGTVDYGVQDPENPERWTWYKNGQRSANVNGTTFTHDGNQFPDGTFGAQHDVSALLVAGPNLITLTADGYPVGDSPPGMLWIKYYIAYTAEPTTVAFAKVRIDGSNYTLPLLDPADVNIPSVTYNGKEYKLNFLRTKKDGVKYCFRIALPPNDLDSKVHFQYLGHTLCVLKTNVV